MIYLKTENGQHVVILEPGNLEAIQKGGFDHTPNNAVLIAYTPDALWLSAQLIAHQTQGTLDPKMLDKLIKESRERPEVKDRPTHPALQVIPNKGMGEA